jgi:hypothetical protein
MNPAIATRRNRTARGRKAGGTTAAFLFKRRRDDALFYSQDIA